MPRDDVLAAEPTRWALDQVDWGAGGRLLALGDSAGAYLHAVADEHAGWSGIGVARPGRPTAELGPARRGVRGDASSLPFCRCAFDVVVAARLFDRVPRPEAVAAELARVCDPRGRILLVLEGRGHRAELRRLVAEGAGVGAAGLGPLTYEDAVDGGRTPTIEVLAGHLHREEVVATTPGPVMTALQELRPGLEPRLRGFVNWATVLARTRIAVEQTLAEQGEWRTAIETGVVLARPRAV